MVKVGNALTVTDFDLVFIQPLTSVPLTAYTVVIDGETEADVVVAPVLQVYVNGVPVTLNVAELPLQIAFTPLTVKVGSALTVMVIAIRGPAPQVLS